MGKAIYTLNSGACALAPATAKTIMLVIAPAQFGIDWISYDIALDGVTAANTPVLIELVASTAATAGTPGSSTAPAQTAGRSIVVGFTGGENYSAEPTVLSVLESFTLSPNAGLVERDFQLGKGYDQDVSKCLGIRCTAPQAVNARGNMTVERC